MKVGLLLCIGAAIAASALAPPANAAEPVEIVIPSGLSASDTAALLREKGIIRYELPFRVAAKLTGMDRKLKSGTYELSSGMSLGAILGTLASGSNTDIKVPIPEGFSARQIADRLQASGICGAEAFFKYAMDHKLEGYLFPTTYFFTRGSGAELAARRMTAEFKRQVQAEYDKVSPKPGLTLHQVVTLASIVEREAVLAQEKPLIASVYFNRMRIRMRLEADPTVQYALGYWKKGLTLNDLQNPSPYNTYNHYGLPPGPICNPGLDSVRGVLRPAPSQAIFFVADTKGGHIFTNTSEEHLKAKQQYKKDLRAIKERLRKEQRRQ